MEESKRHNQVTEQVALGKGLYLKPQKVGNGLRIYIKYIVVGRNKKNFINLPSRTLTNTDYGIL